ncbi:MAG: hypothetical protein PVH28_13275 [Desulfobacterales bacterium]
MSAAQDRYTKAFPISWEQLHRDSRALAWRLVDTFITEVSQDTWILFPWDTESQFVQPIVNIKKREE